MSTAGTTSNLFTATFTVPGSSSGLSTRMRIQTAVNSSAAVACGINVLNAEVEDYQLVFRPLLPKTHWPCPPSASTPTLRLMAGCA